MSDYDYEHHRVSLTNEQSQNDVKPLEGFDYSIDIQPDPHWPGLSADPHSLTLDRHALEDVITDLDALAAPLRGIGTFTRTSDAAQKASFGPDEWYAARFLKQATSSVAQAIDTYGQQLLGNIEQAIAQVRATLANMDHAEQQNVQGFTNQSASLEAPGAPTTLNEPSTNDQTAAQSAPTNIN